VGGFQIDDELKLSGPLHRQFTSFFAFENTGSIDASLAIILNEARP
jgi:hypothetical protein